MNKIVKQGKHGKYSLSLARRKYDCIYNKNIEMKLYSLIQVYNIKQNNKMG